MAIAIGIVMAVILGLVVINRVAHRASILLRRALGDYYEYLTIFAVLALCVLGLLAVLYLLIPLWAWILAVLLVLLAVVVLIEVS